MERKANLHHSIAVTITALLPIVLHAQIAFEEVYGGPEADLGFSVEQTSDGGYALFGLTWNSGGTGPDMYLVKTDENGTQLWDRYYGGLNADFGYDAKQTSDGGYILCGTFSGLGNDTLTMIRTDSQGDEIWTGHYPGALGRDIGYSVLQTTDGGFAVCGFTEGTGIEEDVHLVRTDANGVMVWSSTTDLGGSEAGWCMRGTSDGGFLVVANSFTFADPNGEVHLLRYDQNGDTLWTRTYTSPGVDETHGLWITDDGGCIIAGGNGYPSRDILLIRADDQGNELWRQTHTTTGDEMAYDIQQLDDGGFVCGGRTEEFPSGNIAMHLFRTDADGEILWERTFARGIFADCQSLYRTSDGGFALFGSTTDTLGMNAYIDMYLVKTDGNGFVSIATTDILSTGFQLYPNPAASQVELRRPLAAWTSLVVHDASGQEVIKLNGPANAGLVLSVGHLSPGVYLVRAIHEGGSLSSQRLVIAR